jgi:hypothetical protein
MESNRFNENPRFLFGKEGEALKKTASREQQRGHQSPSKRIESGQSVCREMPGDPFLRKLNEHKLIDKISMQKFGFSVRMDDLLEI